MRTLLFPESSHNKALIEPLAVSPFELPVTKYIEENLQKILSIILETRASSFDGPCEKLLKAKSPNVYCGKFCMECYNFCQQYEDYSAIAGVKSPNYILFVVFFLRNHLNFH